jgi:hypothetical protein
MAYRQHGDVLIFDHKETKMTPIEGDVFYKGMNHLHRLRGNFIIGKDGDDTIIHSKGCEAYHDEHRSIALPEGFYKLRIVKEYSHLDEEAKNIID